MFEHSRLFLRKLFFVLRVCFVGTFVMGGFFLTAEVKAAMVTDFRDIMTRQRISTVSNHEIRFVTPTGVESSSDTITLRFAAGFNLTSIDANDILLSHGPSTGFETSETLAASPGVGVWGSGVSGQVVTLTAPTNAASGEIAAGDLVIIRIGTAVGSGAGQITNPGSAGGYSLDVAGVFGDAGSLTIPIASNDSLSVSATVPAAPSGGTPSSPPDNNGGGGATTPPASPPSTPPAPPVSEPVQEPPAEPPTSPVSPSTPTPPSPPTSPSSPSTPGGTPSSGGEGNSSSGGGTSPAVPIQTVHPLLNPLGFRAVGQDRQVALEWINPNVNNFLDVVLVAREDRFAISPSEGRMVYSGLLNATIDAGLESGREYFYTLFSRDSFGNVSTGAVASARTWMSVAEPNVPTATSSEIFPSPSPTSITRTLQAEWYEGTGTFRFEPLNDGAFEAFREQIIRIKVLDDTVSLRSVQLIVGEDRYQFSKNGQVWVTTVALPNHDQVRVLVEAVFMDGSRGQAQKDFVLRSRSSIRGEDRQPLEKAEIRLFRREGNEWKAWDPLTSQQFNAVVTGKEGVYGFFVQPGRYRLLVRAEGWLSLEQDVEVKGNVLSQEIVLKKTSQVAALVEKTREVLQLPVVQEVNRQVIAPVAVVAAVSNLTAAASSASLLRYLYFLFTQPLLLVGRRRRKQWGVVYNALSKQPVDLAIVRLMDSKSGRVLQTRITDGQGRYSFSVRPGTYRLEVVKKGFGFPTEYLKQDKEDGDFVDLYHGELVQVVHDSPLAVNIPVDPAEKQAEPLKKLLRQRRLRQLQQGGALVGVLAAVASVIILPGWLTGGLLFLQISTYFIFRRLALPPAPKDWGIVYDGASRQAMGQTIVRIFDSRFHKLLETQVTDAKGRYAFFAGQGVYQVMADKQGYDTFRSSDIDLRKAKDAILTEKIHLQPKKS